VALDGAFGGDDWTTTPNLPWTSLSNLQRVIFAPFWADVDTTTNGSGTVGYGTNCVYLGTDTGWRGAFGITWAGVSYVSYEVPRTNRANSFQMLLIDRSDMTNGDFDLQYRYQSIQWDTADSASGRGGFCQLDGGSPSPARAGFASTNSVCCFELPGSGACGALLDGGTNALTGTHSVGYPAGVYTWHFRNGAPSGP
jgi:hypothetical protein